MADVVEVSLTEPTLDRWFYPFNSSPGSRIDAPIFGAVTDQEVGFDPSFDNRDGQMLIGFHQSLEMGAPAGRKIYNPEEGNVVSIPHVGGLHHNYERRAA